MANMPSPNFAFLSKVNEILVELGSRAERYVFEDPNSALVKTRQMGELIVRLVFTKLGRRIEQGETQLELIDDLWRSQILPPNIRNLFHAIRKTGNLAVHQMHGDKGEALFHLKSARQVAVWYYKTFVNRQFKAGPFVPPPDPSNANDALLEELDRMRAAQVAGQRELDELKEKLESEAELRVRAEQEAKTAYEELDVALKLGEEDNARLTEQIEEYEELLVAESRSTYAVSESVIEETIQTAADVADEELTEADTREIIDRQLREAGWLADSFSMTHGKGARPQKGKNVAIAEWPTKSGPADYVLFIGLTPVAVVEAKRKNTDVAGAIDQAKRYSRDYKLSTDEKSPGGLWQDYQIPFLFSTNGRGYLKQLKTKSGIWFQDVRRPTNHSRALVSWHSPEGLHQLLRQDIETAEQQLQSESPDYLPLRHYQQDAVEAVENAIIAGQREMLLAMATGTGKTRTCIGICYRLIKSKRFRRVLFLVDRTSLGEQAADALRDVRLENNQTFADIYDVKELGDLTPDTDTKFHIATIQGMVRRVIDFDDGGDPIPVDQYDCIVVDECHRGYNLDQELSDSEIRFRDESDYISKYSRVIEYFDAFKIGLTATPALHTLEIFGGDDQLPIYQYSYRQAVLDGYLVDHEPPIQIRTKLADQGIKWEVNEEVAVYDTGKQKLELFKTPDEIELDIDSFHKKVVNENFNRVICEVLAEHIDPTLPGKTMVFCVNDLHADLVVTSLKAAFDKKYGGVNDDAVKKITGKADKPLELIRRLKNEQLPSVAVTVDLLTTGIDVPALTNLVFIRRVRSRILYEQMLGRGTRLCRDLFGPGEDKQCFYIFDCVDIYSALQAYTDMKPVVTRPNITFSQLLDELAQTVDADDRQTIKEQLVAKLQQRKRTLKGKRASAFEEKSGMRPDSLVKQILDATPDEIVDWFSDKSNLVEFLDKVTSGGRKILVSDHDDEVIDVATGFGKDNKRPKDYLEEFRDFVVHNQDQIEAIKLCAQRPRDLTRQSLRELQLELDKAGFSETRLRVAWRETKNIEIAATVIGYVRNAILDTPLVPFEDRVKSAMDQIFASRSWSKPQRQWLERIGKQFRENTIVDRDAIDHGQFKEYGGFDRLNKVFDGQLGELLGRITDQIWGVAA